MLQMNLERSYSTGKSSGREKRRRRKHEKKYPFVIGIVHHHFSFPVSTTTISEKNETFIQTHKNFNKKRITKVTEKRPLAKATYAKTKRETFGTLIKKNLQTSRKLNLTLDFVPAWKYLSSPLEISCCNQPPITF